MCLFSPQGLAITPRNLVSHDASAGAPGLRNETMPSTVFNTRASLILAARREWQVRGLACCGEAQHSRGDVVEGSRQRQ